jgi:hypothetical protein
VGELEVMQAEFVMVSNEDQEVEESLKYVDLSSTSSAASPT